MKQGFTLIELLITISIMAVAFGAIVTSMGVIQKNGRDAQRQSDLRNIQSALQNYYADQQFYPITITFGGTLDSTKGLGSGTANPPTKNYLSTIPNEPIPGNNYFYQAMPVGCTNAANSKCQSYSLCAKMENTSNTLSNCSSPYNFELNPF